MSVVLGTRDREAGKGAISLVPRFAGTGTDALSACPLCMPSLHALSDTEGGHYRYSARHATEPR